MHPSFYSLLAAAGYIMLAAGAIILIVFGPLYEFRRRLLIHWDELDRLEAAQKRMDELDRETSNPD